MTFHESDKSLEDNFNKLRERENDLESKLKTIRQFQTNISNLRLIAKEETEIITVNKKEQTKKVIKYYSPKNNAGNDMDEDYRTSQKVSLIINIDKFLKT